jgi:hypothetical protein
MGEAVKAIRATILLTVEQSTKICRRYAGRTMTHGFIIEEDITHAKVDAMLHFPDNVGVPEEPEAA